MTAKPRLPSNRRGFAQSFTSFFRTDLGDDERPGEDGEWAEGRNNGETDKYGDESIDVVLPKTGSVSVQYVSNN